MQNDFHFFKIKFGRNKKVCNELPMVSLYNPNPIQGLKFPISFIKFPFHIFCQLFLRFSFFSYTPINIGSIPIYHKDHVY